MKKIYYALVLGIMYLNATAQISVNNTLNATQLAQILAGSNLNVSNAVITGPSLGYGSFASTSGFAFNSGVILSTGKIINAVGPNNDPNTSDNMGGAGSPQMSALAGGDNSFDAITLEFDFYVQSAAIQFNYMFMSEDYPEFAPPNNPSFNDVFAFYISGPGIVGEQNIALIPNTTLPVTILNVNPVTNSQYYWSNANGTAVQFDGGTVELVAARSGLIPCSTYHLKLVIADIHNSNRNSAVFLKENSLVQEDIVLGGESSTLSADGVVREGCTQGTFDFSFFEVSDQDRTINFTITGSAVNGVDYEYVDSYITIPAGETTGTVFINAFADGLNEGPETVTFTYAVGCASNQTVTISIDDAVPISYTLEGTDLQCFESNDGEIIVNASGGYPGYTYHITDPNGVTSSYTNIPITGVPAGLYSVEVTDTYGCSTDALIIGGQFNADTTFLPDGTGVTYEAPLTISGFAAGETITSVSQIQQVCVKMEHSFLGDLWIRLQSPTGAIITLKEQSGGGSCDLGEPISTGPVDGNSNDVTPGSGYEYCFNAIPNYGTMTAESIVYTRNYTDALGHNYTDNFLPAGSYQPFSDFSGLVGSPMNGVWKILVTDQYGLDNGYIFDWDISLIGDPPDTSVLISQPNEISITGFSTNANCGDTNGAINVSVLNAVLPLSFAWNTGDTIEDLLNVAAGTYTLTVTDGNGCSKTEQFVVNNNSSLSINHSTSPVTCYGGSNGQITTSVTGGTAPYIYSWSNGASSPAISGLTAGDYIVTVTDQQGCQRSEQISVGQNPQVVSQLIGISDEVCNISNGSINISPIGGNGSYGYSWSNGANSQDVNNLNAGTYTLTITDGYGCTGTATYTLVNNLTGCSNYCYTAISQNAIAQSTCGNSNGAINVTIQNAVSPYTIQWSNGLNTEDISGLSAGNYTITVQDANNCSQSATFTVGSNANGLDVISNAIVSETCSNNDGAIDINVSGGLAPYTYLWSNNATTQDVQGLSSGNYSVTVSSANGCSTTKSFTVGSNAGNLQVNGVATAAICASNNGTISQTVNGANGSLSFQWSNGSTVQNITNIPSGSYTCVVTDQLGCSVSNTYIVPQSAGNIALDGILKINEVCGNSQGSINITMVGQNLSYLWSNGATSEDLSNLPAGNYSCTISNTQGCTFNTGTITILNTTGSFVVSNQSITSEVCNNNAGAIDINVFNGQAPYTYLWSNGATTQDISGLDAGTYTLQLTDNQGCSLAHSVVVGSSPGTLAISNAILTHEACVGGVGTNGQGAINITVTGATAPYTYLWSNGATTQDLSGIPDGNYTVQVTSQNGCSLTGQYTVLANGSNIAVASSVVANEICGSNTGAIDITMDAGSGPYSFVWSNGAVTEDLSGLAAGQYSMTATNLFGCSITQSFTVSNSPGSLLLSGTVTNESCGDTTGTVDLSVTGGISPYSYAWSNGSTSQDLSNLSAGNYTVQVTDIFGCSTLFSGLVSNITNGLIVETNATTNEICGQANGSIDVNVSGANNVTYSWSNGETTQDLSALSSGTYSLIVTDDLGCASSITAEISNQTGAFQVGFTNVQNEICANGEGFIDIEMNGVGPFTYDWSNGQSTQDIALLGEGTYTLVATDGAGCQLTQNFTVGNDNNSTIASSASVFDAYCTSSNGAINLTVNAGIAPFTFAWTNGAFTEDVSGLTPGNYAVTVTDDVNCSSDFVFYVGIQNSPLNFSNIGVNNDFCNNGDGAISVNSGGTANLYAIDGSTQLSPNFYGLTEGTYQITLFDQYGCSVDTNIVITNQAFFNTNGTVVNATCGQSNGSINVTVNGGGPNNNYSYLWSNGATTQDLINVPAGTYTVTVTSPGGGPNPQPCGDQTTFVVGADVDFVINGSVEPDSCGFHVGQINQNIASGSGLIFQWLGGETTEDLAGLPAGNYSCTVTFPGGCTQVYDYIVGNISNGTQLNATIQNEICQDTTGSISVSISGGTGPFTLNWSNGPTTQDLFGLSAGAYTLYVVDQADNCAFDQVFDVLNEVTNFNPISVVTHASCGNCPDGTINLTFPSTTTYTFAWDNGATTEDLAGLTPGTYNLFVSSAEGCDTTISIVILNAAALPQVDGELAYMQIYPNPAETTFHLILSLPQAVSGMVVISDLFGKEVLYKSVSEGGNYLIRTNDFAPGMYHVCFVSDTYTFTERLVIGK